MPQLTWLLGAATAFATLLLSLVYQVPSTRTQPTLRVGVDVVQVDVSVLDDKRRPVVGLTAADFTVLEDGRPRPVTVFTPVVIAEHERARS